MSRSKKRRNHRAARTTPPAAASATASDGASSFGALLLGARRDRGISHEDVAGHTHIPKRYLVALENESLAALPGGVYNRAYLRTYAAYVGLDADGILRNYDRAMQERTSGSPQTDEIAALNAAIEKKGLQKADRHTGWKFLKGRVAVSSMACLVLAGGVWVGARQLAYPARAAAARPGAQPAVLKDTTPTSPQVNAETQARSTDTRPELPPPAAMPALATFEKTAEPTKPEDPQVSASISIRDSGVGTGVVDRELVGRSDTFAPGARVIFWTLVAGGRAGDTIRHVWFHQGRTVAAVNLRVGSASWRTQSQRTLAPGADGEWAVEAQDAHGRVLARHAFRCEQ